MIKPSIPCDLCAAAIEDAIYRLGDVALQRRLILIVPAVNAVVADRIALSVKYKCLVTPVIVPDTLWSKEHQSGWVLAIDGLDGVWSEGS